MSSRTRPMLSALDENLFGNSLWYSIRGKTPTPVNDCRWAKRLASPHVGLGG
jgi:hypothetical protein